MFRETSPQRPLFGVENRMGPKKRRQIERTWAHQFRTAALPLVDEQRFAKFFHESDGRPNKSIRLVLCVLILKEVFDLTDSGALEALAWNALWQYALDVAPEDAHMCQKTLHNYRVMLMRDTEGAGLFESTTARLLAAVAIDTGRQRTDSTHVVSNIKLLNRLGLFVQTITQFLEALRKAHPRLCADLPETLRARYLDREGYFADARSSEAPRRLEQAALDLNELVLRFGEHCRVARMKQFKLVRRLFQEQCVPPTTDKPERIELQEKPSSSSLQSPSDPDATYGHKGKGYEVQLTETCTESNPFEVVTAVSVNGANESDQHQLVEVLEQTKRTCGAAPREMHTDTGYGSGENILTAREHGTELKAPIGSKGSEQGISRDDFSFDASCQNVLMCPVGEVPIEHRAGRGRVRLAVFAAEPCAVCEVRSLCPAVAKGDVRVLSFTPAMAAVARRRAEQKTPEFKERHKIRSGIEATNSELKRCHGLGKLRVRGRPRVALAVRLKVLALNIKRYTAHLARVAVAQAA